MSSNIKTLKSETCSNNGIDLWYVRTDEPLAGDTATRLATCLSDQEIKASERFLSRRHAYAYLLAHGMLRLALSYYLEVTPASLEFRMGRFGKPALLGQFAKHVDFSLSHTAGIAVCAIATRGTVGVDVETRQHDYRILDIAKRNFASSEICRLQRLEPSTAADAALELWTLKESFVKALGRGLQLPLNSFAIQLAPTGPPMLGLENGLHEPPELWRFVRLLLDETFVIAIAQRHANLAGPNVCVRQIWPPNPAYSTTCLESNPDLRWVL
jgi:4'-phosphopantetheinyl transferase